MEKNEIRKAMLTTLSEGAMNNVVSFSMEQFLAGFNSVKEGIHALLLATSITEEELNALIFLVVFKRIFLT